MILIGLTGLAGSGKNFVADQITAKYESVRQIAFADPLKHVVHHMFDVPLEDCYTEKGKASKTWYTWADCRPAVEEAKHAGLRIDGGLRSPMSVRDLLQWVGTDLVRGCWNDQHWILLAERRIKSATEEIVIVTDVRFQNEANAVMGLGGTILRPVGRRAEGVPQHVSECVDGITVGGMIDNSPGKTPADILLQVEAYVPGLDRCRVRA